MNITDLSDLVSDVAKSVDWQMSGGYRRIVSLSDQRRMVVSVSNLRMWCFSHWSRTLWPAFTMVFMIISSANVWFFCVAWAEHRAGEDGQKIKGEEFNERMTYSEMQITIL